MVVSNHIRSDHKQLRDHVDRGVTIWARSGRKLAVRTWRKRSRGSDARSSFGTQGFTARYEEEPPYTINLRVHYKSTAIDAANDTPSETEIEVALCTRRSKYRMNG